MKKILLPFIIVIVIVAGYLIFAGKPADPGNVSEPPPPTSGNIDTSNWKTYRNEQYGFEMRYPADYFIKEEGPRIKILSPRDLEIIDSPEYTDKPIGFSIVAFEANASNSLEQWIKEFYDLKSLTVLPFNQRISGSKGALVSLIEPTKIGSNYSGYLIHDGAGVVEGVYSHFAKRDKIVIGIEVYYEKDLQNSIFIEILASFQFLA